MTTRLELPPTLTSPAISASATDNEPPTAGPQGLADLLTLALLTTAYELDPAGVPVLYAELRPLARRPGDPASPRLARCVAAVEAVRLGRPLPSILDPLDRAAVAQLAGPLPAA